MCNHWGLKSWFSGIPEYITNVYCTCMVNNNIDGVYKSGENTFDYFCSIITNNSCPCCNCVSNAIAGTICLLFAIVTHLFCLPIMCCYCNKAQWDNVDCCNKSYFEKVDVDSYTDPDVDKEKIKSTKYTGSNYPVHHITTVYLFRYIIIFKSIG